MSSMHFKDLYSFNQNSFCSFTTHLFHQFRYLKLSKHYYVIGPDTLFAMSLKFYDNYLAFKCMKIYYAINYSKNHQNYFYLLGFLKVQSKMDTLEYYWLLFRCYFSNVKKQVRVITRQHSQVLMLVKWLPGEQPICRIFLRCMFQIFNDEPVLFMA